MLTVVLCVIFFASFAMLFRDGLFSAAIALVNTITSALLATSLFEPVAALLDNFDPTYTYWCDFAALWLVFVVCYVVFRAATDLVSRTQVRFVPIVDRVGGALLAAWTSWVLVSFVAMTLHTAPLRQNFIPPPAAPTTEKSEIAGLAPDQRWLALVQKLSLGAFSASPPPGISGEEESNVFDPSGEFVFKYAERRARFEKELGDRVHRGGRSP